MSTAEVPDRPPADPPPLLLEHDFGEERLTIQGDASAARRSRTPATAT